MESLGKVGGASEAKSVGNEAWWGTVVQLSEMPVAPRSISLEMTVERQKTAVEFRGKLVGQC